MLISELISKLEELKEKHGNIEVHYDYDMGYSYPIIESVYFHDDFIVVE